MKSPLIGLLEDPGDHKARKDDHRHIFADFYYQSISQFLFSSYRTKCPVTHRDVYDFLIEKCDVSKTLTGQTIGIEVCTCTNANARRLTKSLADCYDRAGVFILFLANVENEDRV